MARPFAQMSPFVLARGEATAGGGGGGSVDQGIGLPFSGAAVKLTSNETLTTDVGVSWDAEVYDIGDWFAIGTPKALVVPTGVTRVMLTWNTNLVAAHADIQIFLEKNGAKVDGGGYSRMQTSGVGVSGGSAVLEVVAGDSFELVPTFGSGTPAFRSDTVGSTFFSIVAIETIAPSVAFRGALVKPDVDQTGKNFVAATAVAFDAEVYDTDGFHDNAVNNTRLTVPAGVTHVRLSGGAALASVVVNDHIQLRIHANGTGAIPGLARTHADVQSSAPSLSAASAVIEVVEGDYFEMLLDTATDSSITVTALETWFAIEVVDVAVVSGRPKLLHVRHETSGNGGTSVGTTWTARPLDTVMTNEINGASLSANQITLAAGTYEIRAYGPILDAFRFQHRLRDTTGNVTLVVGASSHAGTTVDLIYGLLGGRFTLAVTSVVEFQYWVAFGQATNGLGISVGSGELNVYGEVFIELISI